MILGHNNWHSLTHFHLASSTAYTRVPPTAHDRSRSGEGPNLRYNYSANNRMDWVDDNAYNGPRRY